jgi:hypothetical protein
MVGFASYWRAMGGLCILVFFIAGIVCYLPRRMIVIRERVEATAFAIRDAIGAYVGEFQRFPDDLTKLEPILVRSKGGTWRVRHVRDDQYEVSHTGLTETVVILLEFKVSSEGKLESYHVLSTSRQPVR